MKIEEPRAAGRSAACLRKELDEKTEQLKAANNVLQGAFAAIDAALMAIQGNDAMSHEARKLCNAFLERVRVYAAKKR